MFHGSARHPSLVGLSAFCLASVACAPQLGGWASALGGSAAEVSADDAADDPGGEGYCDTVADWPSDRSAFESDVLRLLNERRAEGADCGSSGVFGPAAALAPDSRLQCAARNHARNMSENDFFDHTDPQGRDAGERIELAGYEWSVFGENIATGQTSPERVVAAWMGSAGHCANIMDPNFTEAGVGNYSGYYWALSLGRPKASR